MRRDIKGPKTPCSPVREGQNEIIIPELEEAMEHYTRYNPWTENDLAILRRYYGRISVTKLASYLHRTVASVNKKAEIMGIAARREVP